MSVQHSYFVYEVLRRAFLLGTRIRPILNELGAKRGERILDVGCGFGNLAERFEHCRYTGIDSDPERIAWARERYGENENRRFLVADAADTGFETDSFDKAVGYGLLHHLSDRQAALCLVELGRVVKGKIVFSDPVYSKRHWINNLLCRMDQGEYVRCKEEYHRICSDHLDVISEGFFWARNGLAKYYLSSCVPKKVAVYT